jgi:hypothetical protein
MSLSMSEDKLFQGLRGFDAARSKEFEKLIEKANIDVVGQIVKMNTNRIEWADCMRSKIERSCELITKMSIVAFGIGLLFIVIPFIMFLISTPRDSNLLWFSGIGLAETVAILVFQPINRVQKATSDMMQSTMILNSWATEIGLTLFLLDLKENKDTGETEEITDLIGEVTEKHIRWHQHYTEDEHASTAKQKTKAAMENQTLQPNPKTPA